MAAPASAAAVGTLRTAARWLFKKHLLATNLVLSTGLSGLGDVLQQRWEISQGDRDSVDLNRSAHMSAAFGATSGFLCHHWYIWLERFVPGVGIRVVCRKILLDQLVFSPACLVACLAASGAAERASPSQVAEEISSKGPALYLADWLVWPPAQFVNFYFLPVRFRVLFDNLVSLGYDVYVSKVKHRAPPNGPRNR